jgi:anti-sigma regulatory factor (Ser/Thr protein kinase)
LLFALGMKQMLELKLAGGPDAPSRARHALEGLELNSLGETLPLLVTELISNSVRHAGADATSAIELKVSMTHRCARVEVEDQGPGFEARPRKPDLEGGGGFGLLLVDRLADRWGMVLDHPSRIWFEIDLN